MEEVQVFEYLGFIFNRREDYVDQLKELGRKGRMTVNKIWGLGKKICKDDFVRRGNLFNYLVKSVMSDEAEIWGWEERKNLEKVILVYVRWVFKLNFCIPKYLITRVRIRKVKGGMGIRARKYEEKIREMEEYK